MEEEYENFDVDKWKPNLYFLIISLTLTITSIALIDTMLNAFLVGAGFLCFGWSFVFGKYKKTK
ncbi:hypothetical protein LCGC14_0374160 [marine sediment metagenome]|uniref:Uncharacterized protein n=1 Tax=marine sediment metagenome TaxID=412755 RepID=A0A0F9VRC3_9ZZZZ